MDNCVDKDANWQNLVSHKAMVEGEPRTNGMRAS